MKSTRLLNWMLGLTLLAGGGSAFAQQYYGPVQYADHEAQEAMERRGFQDGMFGADRDFQNHRRPDVNNRNEYRDPDRIPGWGQQEYREGFRRGYYQRVRQIYGGERRDGDGDRY